MVPLKYQVKATNAYTAVIRKGCFIKLVDYLKAV